MVVYFCYWPSVKMKASSGWCTGRWSRVFPSQQNIFSIFLELFFLPRAHPSWLLINERLSLSNILYHLSIYVTIFQLCLPAPTNGDVPTFWFPRARRGSLLAPLWSLMLGCAVFVTSLHSVITSTFTRTAPWPITCSVSLWLFFLLFFFFAARVWERFLS